ncbi:MULTISPECIES: hypothetical protein [unclassified Agarivorans]
MWYGDEMKESCLCSEVSFILSGELPAIFVVVVEARVQILHRI